MKRYLIVIFNSQTLQPFCYEIKEVEIKEEEIEHYIEILDENNAVIIDLQKKRWCNSHDKEYSKLKWRLIRDSPPF